MSRDAPRPPVLILGASSLIGPFLTRRLDAAQQPWVALSRNPPPGDGRWIAGDLTASRLPAGPIETVLSLSPIWLLPPALEALDAAGMRRLVCFSSTSRFTKQDSADPGERGVAARLADSEAAVIAFCEAKGIAWTILRPTMIYAEGRDANVSRLASVIRRFGVMPICGKGEGLRQPVHADDLAVAALAARDAGAARNQAYDLPGGETISYRRMVEYIFDGLNKRVLIVRLPPWLWRLLIAAAQPLLPGVTQAMGHRMAEDLTFDAAPATRDFGWSPRPFRPKF
jgi:nucleoside-diphosphate-sugar epimerase